jgi:NAD(P)-dependent dehydrogenase (short-subunit alcohol dehydrogenase family)
MNVFDVGSRYRSHGHTIRVVIIAPGIFDTPLLGSSTKGEGRTALNWMVPFPPRMGNPPEFASLVRQIIENYYLDGAAILLDGAIRMAPK